MDVGGQIANKAILLARTNADVPKHAGISYFLIDVRQPGIEIRPLKEMTGRSFFNEVFMTDARVAADDLIGGEGNGWAVANTTLAYERALSGGGEVGATADPGPIAGNLDRPAGDFTGSGPSEHTGGGRGQWAILVDLARRLQRHGEPLVRDGLVRLYTLEQLNSLNTQRARVLEQAGRGYSGQPQLAKMTKTTPSGWAESSPSPCCSQPGPCTPMTRAGRPGSRQSPAWKGSGPWSTRPCSPRVRRSTEARTRSSATSSGTGCSACLANRTSRRASPS